MQRAGRSVWRWLAVAAIGLIFCALGQGAETYKDGEAIEVFFLGEWREGVVVSVNKRGEVLAEFKFAVSGQRRVFGQGDVRFKFESGALARARTWTDASGKFRVKACLMAIEADHIKVRKPDMTELDVPTEKLCDADKKYLKELQKQHALSTSGKPDAQEKGPTGPQPPSLESFPDTETRAEVEIAAPVIYEPDPVPTYKKLKQGGVGFPAEDFWDRLGAVLPVGGKESWVLAGIENDRQPSRLAWASLANQKLSGRQLLPPKEIVLDYHPRSHRLLTINSAPTKEDRWGKLALTLWEVTPTDTEVKPIVRWSAEAGHEIGKPDPWARLIDGDLVLQRFKKQEYVVWDASKKAMVYRTIQESFFAPEAVLSGGRKYIFLPEDKGVRLLESATGRMVAMLPVKDGASGVGVTEDGLRAAVLGRGTLTVFDLTDLAKAPQIYQAEAIGTPFSAAMAWIENDRLMVSRQAGPFPGLGLFSLKHSVVLWNYEFDPYSNPEKYFSGRRLREVIDGHLVYAAAVSSPKQMLAVGAVKLPEPKVDELANKLDVESLLILKRGRQVRLDVQAGDYTERVQTAMVNRLQENGWTISPQATILVRATIRQGSAQTVTYQSMFGRAPSQTVTVTPYISHASIVIGDKVVWQAATSSGAPGMMSLRAGQNAQDEANRWQIPNPGFFDTIKMPQKILDPDKRSGFGVTDVNTKGLVPR